MSLSTTIAAVTSNSALPSTSTRLSWSTMSRCQWPQPELSVGTQTSRHLGLNKCWNLRDKSPAHVALSTILKEATILLEEQYEHLETCGAELMVEIFMIGRKPTKCRPTVLISCTNKASRQNAMRLVEKKEILAKFPGVVMAESSRLPRPLASEDESSKSNAVPGVYINGDTEFSGLSILISRKGGGDLVHATLGGFLIIDGVTYGLTVAHAFSTEQQEEDFEDDGSPDSEFAFFGEDDLSDSSDEDEEFFETTSRASMSSISTRSRTTNEQTSESGSLLSPTPSDVWSEAETIGTPTSTRKASRKGKGIYNSQVSTPEETVAAKPTVKDLHAYKKLGDLHLCSENRSLDWALIRTDLDESSFKSFEVPSSTTMEKARAKMRGNSFNQRKRTITSVASKSADRAVYVCVGSRKLPLRGKLSSASSFTIRSQSDKFQELWTVTLEDGYQFGEGYCGSWVTDCETGEWYGHVISGFAGTKTGYIVPAHHILQNIRDTVELQIHFISQDFRVLNKKQVSDESIAKTPWLDLWSTPPVGDSLWPVTNSPKTTSKEAQTGERIVRPEPITAIKNPSLKRSPKLNPIAIATASSVFTQLESLSPDSHQEGDGNKKKDSATKQISDVSEDSAKITNKDLRNFQTPQTNSDILPKETLAKAMVKSKTLVEEQRRPGNLAKTSVRTEKTPTTPTPQSSNDKSLRMNKNEQNSVADNLPRTANLKNNTRLQTIPITPAQNSLKADTAAAADVSASDFARRLRQPFLNKELADNRRKSKAPTLQARVAQCEDVDEETGDVVPGTKYSANIKGREASNKKVTRNSKEKQKKTKSQSSNSNSIATRPPSTSGTRGNRPAITQTMPTRPLNPQNVQQNASYYGIGPPGVSPTGPPLSPSATYQAPYSISPIYPPPPSPYFQQYPGSPASPMVYSSSPYSRPLAHRFDVSNRPASAMSTHDGRRASADRPSPEIMGGSVFSQGSRPLRRRVSSVYPTDNPEENRVVAAVEEDRMRMPPPLRPQVRPRSRTRMDSPPPPSVITPYVSNSNPSRRRPVSYYDDRSSNRPISAYMSPPTTSYPDTNIHRIETANNILSRPRTQRYYQDPARDRYSDRERDRRMEMAAAYQADVAYQVGAAVPVPLTAESLRSQRSQRHHASSSSSQSIDSRQSSDWSRRSATTRTTMSDIGDDDDEDITIRVKGHALLNVGGAAIQVSDQGGEIIVSRQRPGVDEQGQSSVISTRSRSRSRRRNSSMDGRRAYSRSRSRDRSRSRSRPKIQRFETRRGSRSRPRVETFQTRKDDGRDDYVPYPLPDPYEGFDDHYI